MSLDILSQFYMDSDKLIAGKTYEGSGYAN